MRRVVLSFLLLGVLFLLPQLAESEPLRGRLYGGEPIEVTSSPVAFIVSSSSICTGMLVGRRYVLTAAHCVDGQSSLRVVLANSEYGVADGWISPGYDSSLPVTRLAQFDLAVLLLSREVLDVLPVPIVRGKTIRRGDLFSVYGYGTSETSDQFGYLSDYYFNGKKGTFVVSERYQGAFEAELRETNTATCQGDSGGPATMIVDGVEVVVGITSYGNSQTHASGRCVANYRSISGFVDLQSPVASAFLANFPGVLRHHVGEGVSSAVDSPVGVSHLIPAPPILQARGRDLYIEMSSLDGIYYLVSVRGRQVLRGRQRKSKRVKKITEVLRSTSPQIIVRLPRGVRRVRISYRYQSSIGPEVSFESPPTIGHIKRR